jgi:hypothetical protein
MAEETGRVIGAREALLRLRLTAGETVECLVDTGFTGALVLLGTELLDGTHLIIDYVGHTVSIRD